MSALNAQFQFKSSIILLNFSATKYLVVKVKSVYPELKINIFLQDNDNGVGVELSKNTWKKILEIENKILQVFKNGKEKKIFQNSEIKVFTEIRHGNLCVCFQEIGNINSRVNIVKKTFEMMVGCEVEVRKKYFKVCNKVIQKSRRMKILTESDSANHGNNNDFINKFKNYLNYLCDACPLL